MASVINKLPPVAASYIRTIEISVPVTVAVKVTTVEPFAQTATLGTVGAEGEVDEAVTVMEVRGVLSHPLATAAR